MYKVTLSLVTIRALNKNPIDDVTVNNDSMRTYDMWASFQVSQWCKLTDTMTEYEKRKNRLADNETCIGNKRAQLKLQR